MVVRLMRLLSKHLFCRQYFHGSLETAELSIREWVLIQNLAPSNPYTIKKFNGWQSPFARLNQFRYFDNWFFTFWSQRRSYDILIAPKIRYNQKSCPM